MEGKRIYLDHAATTPLIPEARAAMERALGQWYNPNSPHSEGRAARAALEGARQRIAAALGWGGRIIFTSGASEALAIALGQAKADGVYASAVEHDAVFRAAPHAIRLPVTREGIAIVGSVGGERPLVAVQHANNETGVIQPIAGIHEDVRRLNGLLLADCAQTAGKLPLPDADFVVISAHKFGGPPGVGALLVRELATLEPVGGQEQGYRFGTENVPAILGMAAALEAGMEWVESAADLRSELDRRLKEAGAEIVGEAADRLPTIAAYRMPGVASATQLIEFDMAGVAVSAGSACSSGSLKASRVLGAMGWEEGPAGEVVRVSFGRGTVRADVERFALMWVAVAGRPPAA